MAKCRLCGKSIHELQGAYLTRVNEKGVDGIWECRPVCGSDLPQETLLIMALESNPPIEPPSEYAQQLAAQAWCQSETSSIVMDPVLCMEFARILDPILADCERERLRLAACGTAALGYFEGCKDEYKSASLDDVLRLRAENAGLRKDAERLDWLDTLCERKYPYLDNWSLNSDLHFQPKGVSLYIRDYKGSVVSEGHGTIRAAIDAAKEGG